MFGVSEGLMRRLQSVQSAAARLVTVAAPRPHYADPTIAPLAARASESHFQDRRPDLSVSDRPGTGVSGRRLSAYFRHQYAPTPIDRHSDLRRPTFNNSFGDRCFAAAGPRLWNTLPIHLWQCDSLGQFKRLPKTYLFGDWDRGALWRFS